MRISKSTGNIIGNFSIEPQLDFNQDHEIYQSVHRKIMVTSAFD